MNENLGTLPRILMVIGQFHPIIGGAEQQCRLQAAELRRRGYDVKVLTGWWNTGTPRREIIDGVPVVRNFTLWKFFRVVVHMQNNFRIMLHAEMA